MDFKSMMAQQHFAIKASLKNLTAAVDAYSVVYEKSETSADPSIMGDLSLLHVKMIETVKQMQSAVYGPLNMMTLHFEEVSIGL